jgi:hypothetical protein
MSYTDLDNILDDIQRFIIHLLNASIKVYIKENRRGKFIIDDDENISINITGLMKQLTGLDQLSTISAKRLFENLCDILPGGFSKKHLDHLMRIKISRKEAKESRYWLRLLDVNQDMENERQDLINEAIELKNILSTILQKSN